MFDHSGHIAQFPGQRRRIGDTAEAAIQNVMSFVSHKRLAIGCDSELGRRPQRGDFFLHHSSREVDNFHRQRKFSEDGNNLSRVRNYDHLLRCGGDNLFPQQRAASTLNEVQVGTNLVGAIDGDVELRMLVQRGQRNAHCPRQVGGVHGCWNASDFQAFPHAFTQSDDCEISGGARA